ncbi:hypothetical protein AA19596_2444 [Acetobacter fabarum DSM 19596]|nr:hypothetical protein AA19596_2444 [Acetobacter fabarum DSM 19596]
MGSANKVPFYFSGYDALDTKWVVSVLGLTDIAIMSPRSCNLLRSV